MEVVVTAFSTVIWLKLSFIETSFPALIPDLCRSTTEETPPESVSRAIVKLELYTAYAYIEVSASLRRLTDAVLVTVISEKEYNDVKLEAEAVDE